MSVSGPDFIALQVRDPEASSTFYTDRLGLVRAERSPPGAVLFDTHPVPFALREPLVDLAASELLGHGVSLWLRCASSATLLGDLEAHGVEIVRPLERGGAFGETFTFRDPDGYLVTIHDAG